MLHGALVIVRKQFNVQIVFLVYENLSLSFVLQIKFRYVLSYIISYYAVHGLVYIAIIME